MYELARLKKISNDSKCIIFRGSSKVLMHMTE